MKSQKRLGLAMVGCGDIAGAYLDATAKSKRCRIAQVMDVNESLAQSRGAQIGVPATADFEEALANPEVDAVIISVPHFLHAPLTLRALARGKHVMCDKPIATTVSDGKKMIAAARRAGLKLSVNYMMRSDDKIRFARREIARGMIGDVIAITIVMASHKPDIYWTQGWSHVTRTDWRMQKAKAGGGVTVMNASHNMDVVFHITGLSARSVVGMAGTFNSPPGVEVEDLSAGVLRLSNGGIMSVLASSCYVGGLPPRVSILGKRGQIELETGVSDKLRV